MNTPTISPGFIQTVMGLIPSDQLGITDAHNHLWIDKVDGLGNDIPILNDFDSQQRELKAFFESGGRGQLDCQPGFAGRNGNRLIELATGTKVNIIACTGFHLRKYYAADAPFWKFSFDEVVHYFYSEIVDSLIETRQTKHKARAGFIKIACESSLEESPVMYMEAAALVAKRTGVSIQIHTEKGSDAERIFEFFIKKDVHPHQLILCHMDKRPDYVLHAELAKEGVGLEYDTFYREKYKPDENVWSLIQYMCSIGLASSLMLATDMADGNLWSELGHGPGLAGFITHIGKRLQNMGFPDEVNQGLLGLNIADRLAFIESK
ncbi:MAG TPA: hypothetical protein DCK95_03215 [Anaerolineaceae bacterium]|nr:hypothetical protein [Anaerolineaceae bacterium]